MNEKLFGRSTKRSKKLDKKLSAAFNRFDFFLFYLNKKQYKQKLKNKIVVMRKAHMQTYSFRRNERMRVSDFTNSNIVVIDAYGMCAEDLTTIFFFSLTFSKGKVHEIVWPLARREKLCSFCPLNRWRLRAKIFRTHTWTCRDLYLGAASEKKNIIGSQVPTDTSHYSLNSICNGKRQFSKDLCYSNWSHVRWCEL